MANGDPLMSAMKKMRSVNATGNPKQVKVLGGKAFSGPSIPATGTGARLGGTAAMRPAGMASAEAHKFPYSRQSKLYGPAPTSTKTKLPASLSSARRMY